MLTEHPHRADFHQLLNRRAYALPSVAESLAMALSDDVLFNWHCHAIEHPPSVPVERLAWDLRRRCGDERGYEIFVPLMEEWGDVDQIDAVWSAADRPENDDDQHITFELAGIHNRGDLFDLMLSDDGEAVRNELDALADRFGTLTFQLAKEAFKPYRADTGTPFWDLHDQFKTLEQAQFTRDMKAGRIPMPGNVVPLHPEQADNTALKLTFFDECRERAPKNWIIKGVLAKGENSSIFGAPGTLKSALLTDLAVHAAAGKDWRGFKHKERCGVVYFAFERSDQVRRRLAAYSVRDGLHDLPIAVAGSIVDMLNPACVDIVVATIRAAEARFHLPVGLIVIDTWSKGIAAGGGDEDRARDQNMIAANLRRIHEQVAIHIAGVGHSGKDETRGERGSNARQGDVDLQVQITGDAVKTATVIKANDGPEGPLTSFAGELVTLGTDEDGEALTAFIVSPRLLLASVPVRKRNPRHDLAMDALRKAIEEHGETVDGGPFGHAASVDHWKDEMFRRGVIDRDAGNPRSAYKKLRDALAAAHRITERDGMIWPVGEPPVGPPSNSTILLPRSNQLIQK